MGGLPPQSLGPKSTVPGHPLMEPYPTVPVYEMEDTFVPHVTPATVTVDVAVADASVVAAGVKPALASSVAPALSVVPEPPSAALESENCASVGAPNETVAGAFPMFWRESATGCAANPDSVDANVADVGDVGANVSVAPIPVA